MMMDGDEKPKELMIKIIDGKSVTEIPAAMMMAFEDMLMALFGRTVTQVAEHRGLTVTEAVNILRGAPGEPKCWRTDVEDESMLSNDVRWWTSYGVHQIDPVRRGMKTKIGPFQVSPEMLEQHLAQVAKEAKGLVSDYVPTMHLRWAAPEGTHLPHETKLEQRWDALCKDGTHDHVWRPIETVVILKETKNAGIGTPNR